MNNINRFMDWTSLQALLKVPRKKYVKKLLEYAALLRPCQQAVPPLANTPIGEQFPHDLELTAEETHKLLNTLIALVRQAESLDFEPERLQALLKGHVEEQLSELLVDILSRMKEDIQTQSMGVVGQAEKLLGFDWQLDMEVATDKGKSNLPVIDLQLTSAKDAQLQHTRIHMKGPEFTVFFKNLQKIREQLGQLIAETKE